MREMCCKYARCRIWGSSRNINVIKSQVITLTDLLYLPILCTVLNLQHIQQTTKMSGQGRDITEQRSIVPSSPFEIQATQDLLQKRIENGTSPPVFNTAQS
jgi:hypothetical protein